MSALHEAVARAIADVADPGADYLEGDWLPEATAAIGVVLAEAQRALEAIPTTGATYFGRRVPGSVDLIGRDAALAVLAELGEDDA